MRSALFVLLGLSLLAMGSKFILNFNQFLQLFILGTALKCHECGTTGQCTDADKPAEKECGTGMDSCLYYTGSKSIFRTF